MAHEVRQIVVGVTVIVAVALLLGFWFGGSRLKPVAGYVLNATFNRIDGLAEGADVRLGGIKIGVVEGQRLDQDYRAVLTFRMNSDIRLPTDTSAAIHTDGLFGTKFVILEPGGEAEMLEPGDEFSFTQGSVIVNELLELIISEGKAQRQKAADGGPAKPNKQKG